jgi:hypothetical protein
MTNASHDSKTRKRNKLSRIDKIADRLRHFNPHMMKAREIRGLFAMRTSVIGLIEGEDQAG